MKALEKVRACDLNIFTVEGSTRHRDDLQIDHLDHLGSHMLL